MLHALRLAFQQLSDPASRRVVWISVLGALAAFVALALGVEAVLTSQALTSWSWLDTLLEVAGGLVVAAVAWLLFPAVVATVASFFLEQVVGAVERRHYPRLPPPLETDWRQELATSLRFLGVAVAVNLLALPVYLFAPGFNLLVYYTVNGYLLGREYFTLVATRRLGARGAADLRRASPLRLFFAGVVIAVLSSVPILNLFAPVIASAFMVHVFQAMISPLAMGRMTVLRR